MANQPKERLPDVVHEDRVVAVVRGRPTDEIPEMASVLRAAGIRGIEITLDSPNALDSIAVLAADGHTVGAGTVMSPEAAVAATDAGAAFLVSPHLDPNVVAAALASRVPVIPGALTPSEIVAAWDTGASAVKLFPASLGGAGYLKAIGGPLGGIPIMPTGGVTAESAAAFLEAGAVAVGVGGWLTDQDLDTMAERAAALIAVCRAATRG